MKKLTIYLESYLREDIETSSNINYHVNTIMNDLWDTYLPSGGYDETQTRLIDLSDAISEQTYMLSGSSTATTADLEEDLREFVTIIQRNCSDYLGDEAVRSLNILKSLCKMV